MSTTTTYIIYEILQILAMVEEAAGTRMYEVKRQAAKKTIEKKDAKLLELKTVRNFFYSNII